jgi:hypothetical protein
MTSAPRSARRSSATEADNSDIPGFSWQEKITEEKGESKVLTIID